MQFSTSLVFVTMGAMAMGSGRKIRLRSGIKGMRRERLMMKSGSSDVCEIILDNPPVNALGLPVRRYIIAAS